jgi:hypothetical protein
MARRKKDLPFTTINVSGAMLPPDLLAKIAELNKNAGKDKIPGLSPESYHLPEGSKLNEAIARSWAVVQAHWKSFQASLEEVGTSEMPIEETASAVREKNVPYSRLATSKSLTSLTNERWLLPLFKELEYGRLTTTDAPVIDEKTYPIKRFYNNSPIHLIGCNLPLDKRTKGAAGAATASPHAMVQEYLNRSDNHLWAFLSNGLQLRILRDNVSLSRQAFVEFDLEAMMNGEIYADFALLWLLCHQSRVEADRQDDCWLEQWSKLARDAGTRVLKDLSDILATTGYEPSCKNWVHFPKMISIDSCYASSTACCSCLSPKTEVCSIQKTPMILPVIFTTGTTPRVVCVTCRTSYAAASTPIYGIHYRWCLRDWNPKVARS